MIIFIPVAGYLADRVSRLRLLQFGIGMYALVNFGLFLWLRYVANYSIPLSTLIGVGMAGAAFKACIYGVWAPLVYDYIPSNRYGTVSAGFAFVGGIFPFLFINFAGLWINGFTRLFGPRGHGHYDYSSIYVLQLIAVVIALLLTRYIQKEERQGRLIAYGRNGQLGPATASEPREESLSA
jgi:MFS family permease